MEFRNVTAGYDLETGFYFVIDAELTVIAEARTLSAFNDAGQIVGYYAGPTTTGAHGFLYSGGSYSRRQNTQIPKLMCRYRYRS